MIYFVPYMRTLARPPDNRRAQVYYEYTDCRSSLSCRAEVLDGQAVMFGRRGVRGSAELSALVLWKAEDDPVEYEAVDGGEDYAIPHLHSIADAYERYAE